MSIRRKFFRKNSLLKMIVDAGIVLLVCLLVFEVFPRKVAFFDLASVHSSPMQKIKHSLLALVLVLVSRTVLMVYKQPWNLTRTISYLMIIVADAMAGVVFYCVAEFVLQSSYPFLLEVTLFALIDITTLFFRLLYSGINESMFFTEE